MKQNILGGLTGCMLLLGSTAGYSQQLNSGSTDPKMGAGSTPDGTSLTNIYSPNLYDGSANINVPIFSYQSKDGGEYGVSLGYSTKGIKSDMMASAIGLGWQLSAGGSIQRVQRDVPDELYVPPLYDPNDPGGWSGGYTDFIKVRGRYNASFETSTEAAETNVYRDKESDDFIVSMGSLSFTFNIGKQRAIFTNPDRKVSIEILRAGVPVNTISPYPTDLTGKMEFRITDEQGIQYYFVPGTVELSHQLTSEYRINPPDLITSYDLVTSWVISKVTLSNGSVINYSYNSQSNIATATPLYATQSVYEGVNPQGVSPLGASADPATNAKVISSISYPDHTQVDFLYETSATRCDDGYSPPLRKIKISSGSHALYYVMDQAYYVANVPGYTTTELAYGSACTSMSYVSPISHATVYPHGKAYRLKLKGITLQNSDQTVTEPFYTFSYNSTRLGIRGAGQDYFGYYNGKSATSSSGSGFAGFDESLTIPYHAMLGGSTSYGQDKTEDITYMQAGILTGLTNAYGGNLQFAYEAHQLSNVSITGTPTSDADFIGQTANDGLRLKNITESEPYHPTNSRITTFLYDQGQRFLSGGYFKYPVNMPDATSTTADGISYQSTYVSPHQFVNGSNHGYGKVTVQTADGSGNLLSKREITYTNFSDATSGNQPRYIKSSGSKDYYTFPYTDKQYLKDWEMGLPLSTTDYDQNGLIVQKTENTYDFGSPDLTSAVTKQVTNTHMVKTKYTGAPNIVTHWGYWDASVAALRSFTDDYAPFTGRANLVKTKSYSYTSNTNYIADSTTYDYDDHHNLKEMVTLNSDGSRIRTLNIYNYSMQSTLGSPLQLMDQAGLEKQVGTERWKLGAGGSTTDQLIDASINTYTYSSGQLSLKGLYSLRVDQPVSYNDYTGYTGGPNLPEPFQKIGPAFDGQTISYFQKASEVSLADVTGSPVETKLMGMDDQYKATMWDSLTGQKIAEASHCRFTDLAYTSFENPQYNSHFSYDPVLSYLDAGGVTGGHCFRLTNAFNTNNNLAGTEILTGGKQYLLSFWVKGSSPTVKVGTTSLTLPTDAAATIGDWRQYIISFTAPGSSKVKITGTAAGSWLDEVRLQPADAQMQSMTYEPLFGISSQTDGRGRISYIEYDALGRQKLSRDQDGNIITLTKNVVQGPE